MNRLGWSYQKRGRRWVLGIFKGMKVPFVVYADFECMLEEMPDEGSKTKKIRRHVPSSFCFLIKCLCDETFPPKLVRHTKRSEDEDIGKVLVGRLEKELIEVWEEFRFPEDMVFDEAAQKRFGDAMVCHVCGVGGFSKDDPKVRDHCHVTGEFRGAAHSSCNLRCRMPKFFPVVFYNLVGYDAHLFVKSLRTESGDKVDCIPNTDERYISFSKVFRVGSYVDRKTGKKDVTRKLRFVDSLKFLNSSLSKLADNLGGNTPILDWFFSSGSRSSDATGLDHLSLLRRKGVFPYDWFDSLGKLGKTELLSKEEFYDSLNDEGISDDDYDHAQKVWSEPRFGIKTMRGYFNLYLLADVLLLADVFENFRKLCLKNHGLDPAWYYTIPGLAWDAALKKTGVKMGLLSDPDMFLMIERGIRGGVSMITKRHAKANNPYVGGWDPKESTKYIQYLDANNLYGWAMSQPLPTGGFEWMTEVELSSWEEYQCFLEVDLDYPTHLHDLHNDFPLAPERLMVDKVEKLMSTLSTKRRYVIHHAAFRKYLELGLTLAKVHRGIRFEESCWLETYIGLNTKLREGAKNEFDKDVFKLMNNSVFGKTMENVRNRVDVRLVTTREQAKKLVVKPNYGDLAALDMAKTKVLFDKPIYLGASILDVSKTLMFDFHYGFAKKKWGDGLSLLMTDTDSLVYEIETDDFYSDVSPDVEMWFDTSNYPKDHPSRIPTGVNKKVPGMFKDEAGGRNIIGLVGLRAKLYSLKFEGGKEDKKCKGLKKSVIKKELTFDDYLDVLLSGGEATRTMKTFQSDHHKVFTIETEKVALNPNDEKRVISEDGVRTLAPGHFRPLRGGS